VFVPPDSIALDFDGVLCNGLAEYFQTAWKTYQRYWQQPPTEPTSELQNCFCRLRPVIETGWEMPILVRVLELGVPETEILQSWVNVRDRQVIDDRIDPPRLAVALDSLRDEWIAEDLDGWLSLHTFYSGTIEQLKSWSEQGLDWWVVTTKEGRFTRRLLEQQGVSLPPDRLFGKEVNRPKYQTLRQLRHERKVGHRLRRIWFVEDRLKTLEAVEREGDLDEISLFFADWGYSTPREQATAKLNQSRIRSLSLGQFCDQLIHWP
jgi:phosphoglycolate phosphatase-like HAD superfamily hydrolase